MRASMGRIVAVTAMLSAVGAVVGAAVGAAVIAIDVTFTGTLLGFGPSAGVLAIGAAFGARVGMVFAPAAAWIFLRRVPLWRSIAETAAGTILGATIAALVLPAFTVIGGMLGFVAAAVRLRLSPIGRGRATRVEELPAF
jgi:hypothetical protein